MEIIEEPIKRLKEKDAAAKAKKRIIKKALREFITTLDRIFKKHNEIGDTAVREKMTDAIYLGFIIQKPHYKLPENFGMFSDEGNKLVQAAIQKFFSHPEIVAAKKSLKTPEDRLIAFQDSDARSAGGYNYFEYFGHVNLPYVLSRHGLARRS
ncbi:MAG TPA: hypothetical protein VGN23_17295 [Verrucomicrobiae bacterium]